MDVTKYRFLLMGLAGQVSLAACGGAQVAQAPTTPTAPMVAQRLAEPADDGMVVDGMVGTLSTDEIQRGIESRMLRFESCFARRMETVHPLRGHIDLAFRVNRDGSVLEVYPKTSSVGDRDSEQCLVSVARTIRFRPPRGGIAEFSFPLEWPGDEEVRPAVEWTIDRIARALESSGPAVARQCSLAGPVEVTAYVSPGGAVLTAGANQSASDQTPATDCVVEAVRAWSLPDPGSYPAKITFSIPAR